MGSLLMPESQPRLLPALVMRHDLPAALLLLRHSRVQPLRPLRVKQY